VEDSFRLHTDIARAAGADEEQIRAVLRLVAEFAIGKAWRAFTALQTYLA